MGSFHSTNIIVNTVYGEWQLESNLSFHGKSTPFFPCYGSIKRCVKIILKNACFRGPVGPNESLNYYLNAKPHGLELTIFDMESLLVQLSVISVRLLASCGDIRDDRSVWGFVGFFHNSSHRQKRQSGDKVNAHQVIYVRWSRVTDIWPPAWHQPVTLQCEGE